MRFGCCGSMVAKCPDGTGVEIVEQMKDIGYDYIAKGNKADRPGRR